MPKFSIIVPIYKVEKYLHQCINSILNQTYKDFELILVDDGSPDRCPVICDDYSAHDGRIRVIHKENKGVAMARQTGIEIAIGEYLIFVDADDSITEDCLETIALYQGADVIRYGHNVECENGNILHSFPREREGYYTKKDIEKEIYPYLIQSEEARYYCPSLWAHAFKRELFIENMLKDAVVVVGEDGACVMPCIYNAESLYCIKKCLYHYNYNDTSATKGRKVFPWDDPIIVAKHLSGRIDMHTYDFKEQLTRKIVHELFSIVVSQFNRKEKYLIIKKDIIENISKEWYREAILQAHFENSLKAKMMLFALKHKKIGLIRIYSKIR